MRTPSRAAPASRHFPISEYRQLRGLQERLVRIDEPSRPIPVKANLIMYEQDHARTFSERSNHAAEEEKTPRPLAKIGASALSLLLVASMWPGIGFADDVQAGSGEPESAQQEAAPSEPSPLGKVAIPENSFGYDSQISLASQNEGEGGSFDNRRRQRIRRWLRPSSRGRCRIRSGRNPGRGRPHHPKGGYRNRPESFQSRGKRTACRQFPEL